MLGGPVIISASRQGKGEVEVRWAAPANADGPVPVIMEFGFTGFRPAGARPPGAPPPPTGPTWQQQVLAKGWGYAILWPGSIQADTGPPLTQGIIGLVNNSHPPKLDACLPFLP